MSALSLGAGSRMGRMMHLRSVDVLELCYDEVGATFEAARETCEQCASVDTCLDWLANRSDGTAEFCPNNKLFERFRAT